MHLRLRTAALLTGVIAVLGLTSISPAAASGPSTFAPTDPCSSTAVERGLDQWTCFGGLLQYSDKRVVDGRRQNVAGTERISSASSSKHHHNHHPSRLLPSEQ